MIKFIIPLIFAYTMSTSSSEASDYPVETPEGTVPATKTIEEPTEQSFTPLTKEQKEDIRAWEEEAYSFVKAYLGEESEITLKACDEAFAAWQKEDNKRYTESQVISCLGAFLGQACVQELDMEWTIITDKYGSDYAVSYTKGSVHAFPHSSVSKRIEDNSYDFMYPVFYATKQMIEEGDYQTK